MEKLTIELDCNKKTCGKCRLAVKSSKGTACGLYVKVLEATGGYTLTNASFRQDYKRLPECIDACKAQRGNK